MTQHIYTSILVLAATACGSSLQSQGSEVTTSKTSQALYEADDANCGAEGYACLNGRTCSNSRCLPAWQPMSTSGAPDPRFAAAATTTAEGKYLISGGCTSFEASTPASTTTYTYTPSTDSWNPETDLNVGRAQHGSILMINDSAPVVFGGVSTCGDLDSVGPGFEKFYNGSWSVLEQNADAPTPRYNMAMVNSDGNKISVFGGGVSSTDNATTDFFRGSPHAAVWDTAGNCTLDGCARDGVGGFYDDSTVRFLSDPPWLSYNLVDSTWANWDEPYDQNHGGDTSPNFENYFSDRRQFRLADDGTRVYVIKNDGTVSSYSRNSGTWQIDTEAAPEGFCNDAPPVFLNGEVFAYSGGCGSTISSVGGRYQPPADGLDLNPPPPPVLHGPNLITIPAPDGGTFNVGETPNIRTISFANNFAIDETEVTVDQYAECVEAEGCTEPSSGDPCNWGTSGHGSHPVNCITYPQAEAYCTWANKRLPTQQEWEYADRYNDGRKYSWGTSTTGYATKTNTNSGDSYTYTSPVGTFSPAGDTALGLKDMSGNVFEWTQSPECFNETGACDNCPAGSSCSNACDQCGNPYSRVIKGGSYAHPLATSRGAFRTYASDLTDGNSPLVGVRCAVTQ